MPLSQLIVLAVSSKCAYVGFVASVRVVCKITSINLLLCFCLCVSDLRTQLADQIKILDSQVDVKQQQLSDLSEFLRRRGDIEAEYARALDKLTERFTHKTKK